MAEHERGTRGKNEKVEQKHRVRQQDSQPLFDQSYAWDQELLSFTEAPFYPRMDEHAAILSSIPLSAQRHEFMMRLHQTYGNRYVQRLIESVNAQAKLSVSAPNDVYEQEADRVADTVTKSLNAPAQRQEEEEEEVQMQEEEGELQAKPILQRQAEEEEEVQTKLQRQPEEEEEEEVQTEVAEVQRQNLADSPEYAWRGSDAPEWYEYDRLLSIVRDKYPEMTMEIVERDEFGQPTRWHITLVPGMNSEELSRDNVLSWMARFTGETVRPPPDFTQPMSPNFKPGWRGRQTAAGAGAPIMEKPVAQEINEKLAVSGDIEMRINSARGGGYPLSDAVREPMEHAFGAEFGGVRLHTDSSADTLNQQLNARAFTTGQDVFFRHGEYSPGSDSGRKLIAHELTHVVQQGGGGTLGAAQQDGEPATDRDMIHQKATIRRREMKLPESLGLPQVGKKKPPRIPKKTYKRRKPQKPVEEGGRPKSEPSRPPKSYNKYKQLVEKGGSLNYWSSKEYRHIVERTKKYYDNKKTEPFMYWKLLLIVKDILQTIEAWWKKYRLFSRKARREALTTLEEQMKKERSELETRMKTRWRFTKEGESTPISFDDKKALAEKLMDGHDVTLNHISGVCFAHAGLVRYLLGKMTKEALIPLIAKTDYKYPFPANLQNQWTRGVIPRGALVGFRRTKENFCFHVALAVGGTSIRGVNGGDLGAGWTDLHDLLKELEKPDNNNTYEDPTGPERRIEVWYEV